MAACQGSAQCPWPSPPTYRSSICPGRGPGRRPGCRQLRPAAGPASGLADGSTRAGGTRPVPILTTAPIAKQRGKYAAGQRLPGPDRALAELS